MRCRLEIKARLPIPFASLACFEVEEACLAHSFHVGNVGPCEGFRVGMEHAYCGNVFTLLLRHHFIDCRGIGEAECGGVEHERE